MKYKYRAGGMELRLNTKRFEQQESRAQYYLDSAVMTDCIPYMPMVSGTFINQTKAISASLAGSGEVCVAAPPFGRFLYEGFLMVDPATGSPVARLGASKVVTPTPLRYSGRDYRGPHPQVTPRWFEKAKEVHGKEWVKNTKRLAGGG